MDSKNILILGGGFGGLSALNVLSRYKKDALSGYRIILVDKKYNFEFLPMIADVLTGWLKPASISLNLGHVTERKGASFLQKEIYGINLEDKYLMAGEEKIGFEYAVIATGGTPVFFGNQSAENNCLHFNNISDVVAVRNTLLRKAEARRLKNLVVIGGGYTGVEVATSARLFLNGRNNYSDCAITIVDNASDIMIMVPEFLRRAVKKELRSLDINLVSGDTLNKYEDDKVLLRSGKIFEDAVCVWVPGVKASTYLDKLEAEKVKTRIKVDSHLNILDSEHKDVFVIGDAAAFIDKRTGVPIRQAVMFSVGQGKIAAKNIVCRLKNKPVKKYWPLDLGYVLPLAYSKAPGFVMGMPVAGRLGYFLHYFMCIYRAEWQNRVAILKDIFSSLFKFKGA